MTVVSLPTPDAVDHVGELPPGIEVLVWDGTGERPAGVDRLEFFVARYDTAAPPTGALEGLPKLKVVQLTSAGVEPWLPIVPPGVTLSNGRGVHGTSTAELAVAGLLALLRDLPGYVQARREHVWERRSAEGLAGRRILVLGAGDIGTHVEAAVRVFDAEVTLVARSARDGVRAMADLPALLPAHDVVILALPHTTQTHKLVDADFLAALPDGAIVVNVARGAILDTDALLAELTAGRLRAFLDVTDPEPLPVDHPLWDAPGLLLTPHVGGGTEGWPGRAYRLVREQLLRFHAGEPLHNVVEHGY